MKALIVNEADDSVPKITLDKENNIMEISGVSLPEDVIGFYQPVLNWIDGYLLEPNSQTDVNIKLTYFNTASSKVLLEILSKFDNLTDKGLNVLVTWFYPQLDEDLLATGKEFKSMLKTPFNFVPYIQE